MKKSAKFFLAACLFPLAVSAQAFHWESPVDAVTADGYYRILLQPDVTSKLRTDFSDVRLYDEDSVETPYLICRDEATQGIDRFVTYQIVEKDLSYRGRSHITVKNDLGNAIDHIVLEVNNAQAQREMTLTASYDGVHFFALVDHFTVTSFNTYNKGERKTTSLLRFDFPLTDYVYYRFNFDDWRWWWHDYNAPVFIVRAGYIEPTFIPEECLQLPSPRIGQNETVGLKESVARISFADTQYVDHLRFMISARNKSGDYYRAASLYEVVEQYENHVLKSHEVFITSTILSSLNANEINLGRRPVKNLVLRISNEDNLPLRIDSVLAFQVKHYLVADLEKGKKYFLRFGNDSIAAPVYDLAYFRNKIPEKPAVINTGKRTAVSPKAAIAKPETESDLLKDTRIIWAAIVLVILLLALMTVRMLKEMKKKE